MKDASALFLEQEVAYLTGKLIPILSRMAHADIRVVHGDIGVRLTKFALYRRAWNFIDCESVWDAEGEKYPVRYQARLLHLSVLEPLPWYGNADGEWWNFPTRNYWRLANFDSLIAGESGTHFAVLQSFLREDPENNYLLTPLNRPMQGKVCLWCAEDDRCVLRVNPISELRMREHLAMAGLPRSEQGEMTQLMRKMLYPPQSFLAEYPFGDLETYALAMQQAQLRRREVEDSLKRHKKAVV